MNENSHLYALLTQNCNLQCPHCMIYNNTKEDFFNEERFLDVLRNWKGDITLFGGEPTLYRDRFMKAINTGKIGSISTNLMNLDDDLISVFKDTPIASSWNLHRFTESQYNIWIKNVERMSQENLTVYLLITMTKDLIEYPIEKFMILLKSWCKFSAIQKIKFEQVVDLSLGQEHYDAVDDWLCKLVYLWEEYEISIENTMLDEVLGWHKYCIDEYSLYPDGRLLRRCPENITIQFCDACLDCNLQDICTPCRLQKCCTFPKKLYQMLTSE